MVEGQKGRGGANECRTGWVRGFERWCPGSRRCLGRREVLGSWTTKRRVSGAGSGSPHRARASAQAPAAVPVGIMLPFQAPGSVCPFSCCGHCPRWSLYPLPFPHSHLVPSQRMSGIHASGTRVLQVLEAAISPHPGHCQALGTASSGIGLCNAKGHFPQPIFPEFHAEGSLALHLDWGGC